MSLRRPPRWTLALLILVGCQDAGGANPRELSLDDGSIDRAVEDAASTAEDAGALQGADGDVRDDASDGAGSTLDGADAAVDGGEAAQLPDGGEECEDCHSRSLCEQADCIAGICQRTQLANGTLCGEDQANICAFGQCVMRGCGDGFREHGPQPTREACDDGNQRDGDGCSSTCDVAAAKVDPLDDSALSSYPLAQGPSFYRDGLGNTLIVFVREDASGKRVRARLITSTLDQTFDLSVSFGQSPFPSAVGLPRGGFLVAWGGAGVSDRDVLMRRVRADGSLGQTTTLSGVGDQTEPQLALVGPDLLAVWSDRTLGVRARWLTVDGNPDGDEFFVDGKPAIRSQLRLLSDARGNWAACWIERLNGSDEPAVRCHRYAFKRATDEESVTVAKPALSFAIGQASSGTVVVYATPQSDGLGNVRLRTVPSSGELTTSVVDIAVKDDEFEGEPTVARFGDGYVVGYWAGQPGQLRFQANVPLPSEAAVLETRLASGAESALSLSAVEDGVWFAWSGVDGPSLRPTMSMFFLPGS